MELDNLDYFRKEKIFSKLTLDFMFLLNDKFYSMLKISTEYSKNYCTLECQCKKSDFMLD